MHSMHCPFGTPKSGEPSCNRRCPFWYQDEDGEVCRLSANLLSMAIGIQNIAKELKEIKEVLKSEGKTEVAKGNGATRKRTGKSASSTEKKGGNDSQ